MPVKPAESQAVLDHGLSSSDQDESARLLPGTEAVIADRSSALEDGVGEFPPLAGSFDPPLPKWNDPPINKWRLAATFYSFVILGINDAAYGPLIPYLEKFYDITYSTVSLVFLSPLIGYAASAALNNMLHMKFGQRGVAILAPTAHISAYVIICLHPPFMVLTIAFILAGFGNGLSDAAWNAWIGGMDNANEILGVLHGFYGLGGVLAPTIATSLITKAHWKWYQFYYLVVAAAVLELILMSTTFWNATAEEFQRDHGHDDSTEEGEDDGSNPDLVQNERFTKIIHKIFGKGRTTEAMQNKVTWLISLFLAVYTGVEVGIGGWIVTFMMKERHASPFASGMSSTGFWLGVTIGRIVLGFVTPRLFKTEKHAVACYLSLCIVFELLFWVIPNFYVSAAMVALLGFFLGPLFPAAIVAATKLLPKHLHVSAIGFAGALGASGATGLPYGIGAIAESKGVAVLQPFLLALLVADLAVWLILPNMPKRIHL